MRKIVWYLLITSTLAALPEGEKVISGEATSFRDGSSMKVKTSDRAIIEYQSFHVGSHEKIVFDQPSSSSVVLNRVQRGNPSQILGSIESNGKIVLVNPDGVYFGKEAQIKASSLIISTLDIKNEDFLGEKWKFTGRSGTIVNEGTLDAEHAIVLIGSKVSNIGTVRAKLGEVVLATGNCVTLDFVGDRLLQFAVDGEVKELTRRAGFGETEISTRLAKRAISEIVNHEGKEAGSVFIEKEGEIFLVAASLVEGSQVACYGKEIQIEGTIESQDHVMIEGSEVFLREHSKICASADQAEVTILSDELTSFQGEIVALGNHAWVETSGRKKIFVDGSKVVTDPEKGGAWLIDPVTLTIVSGSDPNPGCTGGTIGVETIATSMSTVILCSNQIDQTVPIMMVHPTAGIVFTAPPLETGELFMKSITTHGGRVQVIDMDTIINEFVQIDTTGGGNIRNGNSIDLNDVSGTGTLKAFAGLRGDINIGDVDLGGSLVLQSRKNISMNKCSAVDLGIEAGSAAVVFKKEIALQGVMGVDAELIYVGAPISAEALHWTAIDSILNVQNSKPIDLTSTELAVFMNAVYGTIGTSTSPIEINTQGLVLLGGKEIYITGDAPHVEYLPLNKPCTIVLFGQHYPCSDVKQVLLDFLPKSVFYSFFFSDSQLGIGPSPLGFEMQRSAFHPLQHEL